jgi:hypothetical protein
MLNQLQRGDEPALRPCRRSGFLRRPLVDLNLAQGAPSVAASGVPFAALPHGDRGRPGAAAPAGDGAGCTGVIKAWRPRSQRSASGLGCHSPRPLQRSLRWPLAPRSRSAGSGAAPGGGAPGPQPDAQPPPSQRWRCSIRFLFGWISGSRAPDDPGSSAPLLQHLCPFMESVAALSGGDHQQLLDHESLPGGPQTGVLQSRTSADQLLTPSIRSSIS